MCRLLFSYYALQYYENLDTPPQKGQKTKMFYVNKFGNKFPHFQLYFIQTKGLIGQTNEEMIDE